MISFIGGVIGATFKAVFIFGFVVVASVVILSYLEGQGIHITL